MQLSFDIARADRLRQNSLFSGLDCLPGQHDLFDADDQTMTTITIRQPWASLIANGTKRVENRVWRTRYTGPLVVQAGAKHDAETKHNIQLYDRLLPEGELPFGAILGAAWLYGCFRRDDLPRAWKDHEHAEPDQWCWALGKFVPLQTPIACSGQQGLFVPKLDALQQEQIDELINRTIASYDPSLLA
jgi:hypothetical protein